MPLGPYRLAIDIGGTFTDSVLVDANGQIRATAKTPTTPDAPARGALSGAGIVLEDASAGWADVGGFIHGTTLATNALIERRGARVGSVTTQGFRDILEIAYERRYSQYAIDLVKPDLIVPRHHAWTIGGRMNAQGAELAPLDLTAIPELVSALRAAGIEALAICLLHAYANPLHELQLRDALATAWPEGILSLSHEVSPEAREFDRLCTTVANAYIRPLMATYLSDLKAGFSAHGLSCPILMMTAGGGMTTLDTAARLPIRLVESGPAGGAILAARIAQETGAHEVLSFDMGGTTAKLCLIDDFRPQTARKFEISRAERFVKGSGMPVRIPVIEMIEIGAGGGSIATVDYLGRLHVGPQSAGAVPGPVAFAKGGTAATVTDADVVQGLIDPARFAEGRLRIDMPAAQTAIRQDIGASLGLGADDAARGISEIVDENMAGAGRMHAVESGKDLSERVMIAFGGNGPLHATRVARRAQVRRIVVPQAPGVGSAVGFLFAPVSYEIVRSHYALLDDLDIPALNRFFDALQSEAEAVVRPGAPGQALAQRRVAFMRYRGQGHEIEVTLPNRALTAEDLPVLRRAFEAEYKRQFRRTVPDMVVEILNWAFWTGSENRPPPASPPPPLSRARSGGDTRQILCDVTGTWRAANVFDRATLEPGDRIMGPALIVEPQTTTFVSADFQANIDAHRNIWLIQQREPQA